MDSKINFIDEYHKRIEEISFNADEALRLMQGLVVSGQSNFYIAFNTMSFLQKIKMLVEEYENELEKKLEKEGRLHELYKIPEKPIEIDNTKNKEE